MNEARQLYELQGVDLEIDSRRERISELESQLGESEALATALQKLQEDRKRLAEVERSRHSLEWEANDLGAKVKDLEKKLYGGSIRNPKELSSLQEETEHLKAHHSERENNILDIMMTIESLQESLAHQAQQAASIEAQHLQAQHDIRKEMAQLEAEVQTLEDRRTAVASRINGAALELYEVVRVVRQGRAVARVEGGRCQGCRIALPMTELQKARSPYEMVQCGSCGRILFIG